MILSFMIPGFHQNGNGGAPGMADTKMPGEDDDGMERGRVMKGEKCLGWLGRRFEEVSDIRDRFHPTECPTTAPAVLARDSRLRSLAPRHRTA